MQEPILFPAVLWVDWDRLQRLVQFFPEAKCPPIRGCHRCGTPFPFGPGTGRRETAVYCTPKCQRADYYEFRTGKKQRPEPVDWEAVEKWAEESGYEPNPDEVADPVPPLGDSILALKPMYKLIRE